MDYKDKIVAVTGGGCGIGQHIAKAYAAAGAMVLVVDKDVRSGEQTAGDIKANSYKAFFFKSDVSQAHEIIHLFDGIRERFGKVNIWINNAGVSRWKSPYDLEVEEWDSLLNTNLRSVFLCSREAAKMMRDHGGGSIVNISSTRALMSEPHSEAYAASKGGIIALTHALAASFAPDHIRVNCISPGWIETGDYTMLNEKDHQQHFSGRVGKPEDVSNACLFLTREGNDFINGTNIVVDGGMTKKMIYEE